MSSTLTALPPPNFTDWTWADFEPLYRKLLDADVNDGNAESFMWEWSGVQALVSEFRVKSRIATMVNTIDETASARYRRYTDEIFPETEKCDQLLRDKVLTAGVSPPGFELPIRRFRAQLELFRENNLALLAQEKKLVQEYEALLGGILVEWDGKKLPVPQMQQFTEVADRAVRERAWRAVSATCRTEDKRFDDLWRRLLETRTAIAANAGLDSYRTYRWVEMLRLDYRPELTKQFDAAIREVAVPTAGRLYRRQAQRTGAATFRPWDIYAPSGTTALHPYETSDQLIDGCRQIFNNLDATLGSYFQTMIDSNLLDLESRPNKANVGICFDMAASKHPFILMNGSGIHHDVLVLLHEAGHAFQCFECRHLPYMVTGANKPAEFAEVASETMELLATPHLGTFYDDGEAVAASIFELRWLLLVWTIAGMGDSFQHWVYENVDQAMDTSACDERWLELHRQFAPEWDLSGIEGEVAKSWRQIFHFFGVPFYYIDYAMAQCAAVAIWRKSLADPTGAVEDYRRAIALGGSRSLPELFRAAGTDFDFTAKSTFSLRASRRADVVGPGSSERVIPVNLG